MASRTPPPPEDSRLAPLKKCILKRVREHPREPMYELREWITDELRFASTDPIIGQALYELQIQMQTIYMESFMAKDEKEE